MRKVGRVKVGVGAKARDDGEVETMLLVAINA
jgi:hypothetical protein